MHGALSRRWWKPGIRPPMHWPLRRRSLLRRADWEDETGRLAQGYAADVLVIDGDVSTDIAALGHPQLVIIRGTSLQP